MTRTEPCRRITLHLSHIFLTEGRTFMSWFLAFAPLAASWILGYL